MELIGRFWRLPATEKLTKIKEKKNTVNSDVFKGFGMSEH